MADKYKVVIKSGCNAYRTPDIKGIINSHLSKGYTFTNCTSFNQDISNWDVSKVKHNENMFMFCPIEEKYKPKFS